MGDQVIGGLGAALVDVAAQEGGKGVGGGDGAIFGGTAAVRHIHADHGVGPCEQVRGHGFGDAEQAGDDDDGEFLGEMGEDVVVAGREGVDQLVRQARDFGGKGGDAARGEGAQDKAAQPGVARGFQFQHGMGFDGVEGFQVVGDLQGCGRFAPHTAVAEDGGAGGGRGRAGQAVVSPMEERASGAGAFIERVGVLHEGGVGRRLVQGDHRGSRRMPWAISTPMATMIAP